MLPPWSKIGKSFRWEHLPSTGLVRIVMFMSDAWPFSPQNDEQGGWHQPDLFIGRMNGRYGRNILILAYFCKKHQNKKILSQNIPPQKIVQKISHKQKTTCKRSKFFRMFINISPKTEQLPFKKDGHSNSSNVWITNMFRYLKMEGFLNFISDYFLRWWVFPYKAFV